MKIDEHEPDNIEQLIQQSSACIRTALNRHGYADYMWTMWDGGLEQVERKQVSEILSDMNGVEEQLKRQLQSHPDIILWLLVEGILEPGIKTSKGLKAGIWQMENEDISMKSTSSSIRMRSTWFYQTPYEKYEGWLVALERVGVRILRTNNWMSTARMLALMEKSAQHEHTILQRHLKPKIPKVNDPQVMTLLGAYKSGVDVKLAEVCIEKFRTVHALINCSPEYIAEMVPGMGIKKAQQLLTSFGRSDI